jgi:RNA polymerase sigma-70 factor, ECF subfamily
MTDATTAADALLDQVRAGEADALGRLFDAYRPRLRTMVRLRMDARLAARLDPSDVLQDTYLDVARQVAGYLRQPRVGVYVWLRGLVWQRLLKLQRRHLGARCRAVGKEMALNADASSALAARLPGSGSTPSRALAREEVRLRVQQALATLTPRDREVLLLREIEGLTNNEVAEALGLTASAATMRYGRALFKLQHVLAEDDLARELAS